jgi:hypothetical protein
VSVPSKLAAAALALAVVAGGIGWQLQSSVAATLGMAEEVQSAEVGSESASPPSIASNRHILQTLDDAIGIRHHIDSMLRRVEAIVDSLRRRQALAHGVSERSRSELAGIARALGGAARAARASVGRLGGLKARLDRSVVLARRIAVQLRRLDHKLGPTVARPRR